MYDSFCTHWKENHRTEEIMVTILFYILIIVGLGLLVFGAWITYKGVTFVLAKYDWMISAQEKRGAISPLSSRSSVNQMLSTLNRIVETTSIQDLIQAEPNDTGRGEPDRLDAHTETGVLSDETRGSMLDSVAKIIDALPNLLKADFGPIVVVCFTGLVLMGGGIFLLITALNTIS